MSNETYLAGGDDHVTDLITTGARSVSLAHYAESGGNTAGRCWRALAGFRFSYYASAGWRGLRRGRHRQVAISIFWACLLLVSQTGRQSGPKLSLAGLRPHAVHAVGDQRINPFGVGGGVGIRQACWCKTIIRDCSFISVWAGDRGGVVRSAGPNGAVRAEFGRRPTGKL